MITLSLHPTQTDAVESLRATAEPDDVAVICRDTPGVTNHPGGRDCWCGPYVVRLDDDSEFARIAAIADQRQG